MSTGNNFEENGPLYLPEGIEPENTTYSWAYWYKDIDNLKRAEKFLYKIVPSDRHPNLYSDGSVKGTISRLGYFLIERPKIVCLAFKKHLEEINDKKCPDVGYNKGMTEKKIKNAKRLLKRRIKTGLYNWVKGEPDSEDGIFRLEKGAKHVNGV